jgi:hypothetical protein
MSADIFCPDRFCSLIGYVPNPDRFGPDMFCRWSIFFSQCNRRYLSLPFSCFADDSVSLPTGLQSDRDFTFSEAFFSFYPLLFISSFSFFADDSVSLPTGLQSDRDFTFSERAGCNNGKCTSTYSCSSSFKFKVIILSLDYLWTKCMPDFFHDCLSAFLSTCSLPVWSVCEAL